MVFYDSQMSMCTQPKILFIVANYFPELKALYLHPSTSEFCIPISLYRNRNTKMQLTSNELYWFRLVFNELEALLSNLAV